MVKTLNIIFTIILFILLILPVAQKKIGLFKRQGLINVTVHRTRPELNLSTFTDGSFQRRFDTWFMQTCGLWGYLVKTHNQISYQYFQQIASHYGNNSSFMVGNDYNLFQTLYLRDFNGDTKFDRPRLEKLVRRIKILQDYMEERGKTVLVLISANKLSLQPEIVPKRFRKPLKTQGPRAIDAFVEFANQSQVNLVRSHTVLENYKKNSQFPTFAKPAAHWNSPAACQVAKEVLKLADDRINQKLPAIKCPKDYRIRPYPVGADHDLANVINVWNPKPSYGPTPYSQALLIADDFTYFPNMLYVGTSFLWSIFDHLETARAYPRRDFFYYGTTNHFSTIPKEGKFIRGSLPVRYHEVDWENQVFNKDVIVLEINEARLNQIGFNFLKEAVRYIKVQGKK